MSFRKFLVTGMALGIGYFVMALWVLFLLAPLVSNPWLQELVYRLGGVLIACVGAGLIVWYAYATRPPYPR